MTRNEADGSGLELCEKTEQMAYAAMSLMAPLLEPEERALLVRRFAADSAQEEWSQLERARAQGFLRALEETAS